MRCDVDADSLASVFVLNKDLEPVPDPFRLQPEMLFVIGFESYRKFVEHIPGSMNILYFTTNLLHTRMSEGNETALLKSFYIDMALAICKELYFAEEYKADASCIRHAFPILLAEKPIQIESKIPPLLRDLAQRKGFPLPAALRIGNTPVGSYRMHPPVPRSGQ